MKKNTRYILIGLSIILGIMGIVIDNHSSFKDDLEALKPVARENKIVLALLSETGKNIFTPATETLKAGSNLSFEVSSNMPIHLSLLLSVDDTLPEILIKSARIPPGKNMRLDKMGERYTYQTLIDQSLLKFCILARHSDTELRNELSGINDTWPTLPAHQCSSIAVK